MTDDPNEPDLRWMREALALARRAAAAGEVPVDVQHAQVLAGGALRGVPRVRVAGRAAGT